MKSLSNKDLNYFVKGVADLEEYLLSSALYWNLPGLSRLTLGGLYFSKVRLEAISLQSGEKVLFDEAVRQMELLCLRWRVAQEKKIQREITSRMNLWQNYLSDYWSSPENYGVAYRHEVRWRVLIQILSEVIDDDFKEESILNTLDERLRLKFLPGEFLWAKELTSQFDEQKYWFLYGKLPEG